MLHIVIKSTDKTNPESIAATIQSLHIHRKQQNQVKVTEWRPSKKDSTIKNLVDKLSEEGASSRDPVLIVLPGTIFSKGTFECIVESGWDEYSPRVKLLRIKDHQIPNLGLTPAVYKLAALRGISFTITNFGQDEQCRLFLYVSESEGRFSTLPDCLQSVPYSLVDGLSADSQELFNKKWYFSFNKNWQKFLKSYRLPGGYVSRTAQAAYLYMLQFRLLYNVNGSEKNVLSDEEVESFYADAAKNLQYISTTSIMSAPGSTLRLNREMRLFLAELKNPQSRVRYTYNYSSIVREFRRKRIESATSTSLIIESMDFYKDNLIIAGRSLFVYDPKRSQLICRCGDKVYPLPDTHIHSDYKVFGKLIFRNPTFRVDIPADVVREASGLTFHLVSSEGPTDVRMKVKFSRAMAKLNGHEYCYWRVPGLDRILKYREKVLWFTPNTKARAVAHELRYLWHLLIKGNSVMRRAARLRILYWITKPIFRRSIWFFSDKPYKAGDNGEYLWDYARKQNDGIKKVYSLGPTCPDVSRFKKERKDFLNYGSLRQKLNFLNADMVFATHENQVSHNDIKYAAIYLRDLFNYSTMFIQHGLSVQEQSNILNIFNDNVKKYFVASRFETENLLQPQYGYTKLEIITSGVPRYDGLVSSPRKQILITPSWRKYLAKPGLGDGKARRKSEVFSKSKYFDIYNSLVNDKQLLSAAEKTGYKIVFLLHPVTSAQIDDFVDHDKRVEVLASTDDVSYEKMLTESDLMVTDYSGIQFDFAYMKKPILYFQPEELPPTYDEAVFTYQKDALGEIVTTHEQTVSRLCEYMKDGCQVPEKYGKRMDKFFYHHDHNNSKRIYDEAIKLQKELYMPNNSQRVGR